MIHKKLSKKESLEYARVGKVEFRPWLDTEERKYYSVIFNNVVMFTIYGNLFGKNREWLLYEGDVPLWMIYAPIKEDKVFKDLGDAKEYCENRIQDKFYA